MGMPANTSATATRIAQSIAALPPLPATAQEILTCFGDEFIDADKVTAVVIYKDERFSDHAPLTLEYDYPLPVRELPA